MKAERLEIELPHGIIDFGTIYTAPIVGESGIVLSGKLPRWLFAAIARKLARIREWVGVYDVTMNKAVVVHSKTAEVLAGDTFDTT